jgi:hypothetical protein
MAFPSRVVRSLTVAVLVAASAAVAGCSADRAAGLTIVRLPTGFHAARPGDEAASTRAGARTPPAAIELATLRHESAHRRAAVATATDPASSATGGFVCQIDMGSAPQD